MKINKYQQILISYLKENLTKSKKNGLICGLSGGIDSAVVINLMKQATSNVLAVIMPCESNPVDETLAIECAKKAQVPYEIINLDNVYQAMKNLLKISQPVALMNLKPRLRMSTLYALANEKDYLVVGTGNASEYYVGYFTKHGDGAFDLAPLFYLRKKEVYELACLYNIPEEIIQRTPSAGLIENQTDEKEMGFTYQELDDFINHIPLKNKEHEEKIKKLHINSEHKKKQNLPPEF